ncbi:MAG: helix-turn-helix domain-containing protein [bacterium]|nr:helix-turn-helix domain-containing protein [bacterium]
MGYNEKELKEKLEQEKDTIVLPSKKETIGDILKNKRLETGKTIDEISDYLRIKAQYLSALEENNFNKLPGSAYVIGFIKSYASYLSLDVNAIVIQYKQETGGFSQSNNNDLAEDENVLIKDPTINSNHIIIASIIVLFGIIFVSVTGSKDAENVVENDNQITEDLEISIKQDNISSDNLDVGDDVVKLTNEPKQDLKISTPEFFETKIDSVDIKKDELKPVVPETVEQKVVEEEYIPKEYGVENKENSNIYIKATKKVWVKLKKDGLYKYDTELGDIGSGITIFETILEEGDVFYIPQGDSYYLTIGNAQGVNIYADGTLIAPLSKKEVSRHNIEMDVEKLKNGTAYVRNRIVE